MSKGLNKPDEFKGKPEYATSKRDLVLSISKIATLPRQSVQVSHEFSNNMISETYGLRVTIFPVPEKMLNDSLIKTMSDRMQKQLIEHVANLTSYDDVSIIWRSEDESEGILKRTEFIVEKTKSRDEE
jgi:hypothetical protein